MIVAETAKAGHGEEGGIGLAFFELAHAGLHVAAEGDDLKVRTQGEGLSFAAQRSRAETGALRQVAQRGGGLRDKPVTRIFAFREGDEDLAGRQKGGDVLQAVHRDIDVAAREGVVEFAGEEALAAGIDQPLGRQLVAGRREGHDLGFDGAGGSFLQAGSNLVGLRQGERRAPCAEADGAGRGGGAAFSHCAA